METAKIITVTDQSQFRGWREKDMTRKTSTEVVPVSPDQMIAMAINSGRPMEDIKELIALRNAEIARLARIQFIEAKSQFQKMCPPITKNRNVHFEHKNDPGSTDYNYAELAFMADLIRDAMEANGFTYDWKTRYEGTDIWVKCILSHIGGHSEFDEMKGPLDTSGKKTVIQQSASTVSFLRRYTLKAVLGLSEMNEDNDGKNGGDATPDHLKERPTGLRKITVDNAVFSTLSKAVKEGKTTVAEIEKAGQYALSEEQKASLKIMES